MRPWSEAWQDALYGQEGFFLTQAPLAHFRTNVAIPLFASAVRRLAGLVDDALGRPDPFDVVDVGAGRGELLAALPDVPGRWRLTGVDLGPPPPGFAHQWTREVPTVHGLLIANEWLDSIPLDLTQDGRLVLVDVEGAEGLGAPTSSDWAARWWPGAGRVEVGAPRDLAWAAAVARVSRGLAVAIDYGHTLADRRATLTGYRDGRQTLPVPDGSCDLTAHVALDAVAAATGSVLVRQREALQSLGVTAALPAENVAAHSTARSLEQGMNGDIPKATTGYGERLVLASQARELLDPEGLGGFGWLLRPVGLDLGWMDL